MQIYFLQVDNSQKERASVADQTTTHYLPNNKITEETFNDIMPVRSK